MFNPWSYKCEVTVGPIDPARELRLTPAELLHYIDAVRSNKLRNGKLVERTGNLLINDTRFNYFDGKRQIGLACGEYTDLTVLQNLKRFILQPDVGFIVDSGTNGGANNVQLAQGYANSKDGPAFKTHANGDGFGLGRLLGDSGVDAALHKATTNTPSAASAKGEAAAHGIHSDLYRRQIPRESLSRMLDMPIFNGTNVKNVVQSGKSLLYYLLTYLLANCMRMYVLPGPQLPCFSAVLPLHALCTIFDMNINALPRRYLIPIENTEYAYLRRSLNVKYMFRFPPNVSFLDRRDPVIHDGGIDTCDKLFLTDDEFSDFRVNCTLNCRNRNEDYDGDTNNPGFCKGIESHTEIKYNMRTQLMPLLRNRHIFSQNILYRLFVILAADPPYADTYAAVTCDPAKSIEQNLYEQVERVVWSINVVSNPEARRRAVSYFGESYYHFYYMYVRENLYAAERQIEEARRRLEEMRAAGESESVVTEYYVNALHKLDGVWKPSAHFTMANCFSVMDNAIRSMALVLGDQHTTRFVDELLRDVHERVPHVFIGEQPMCYTNIVNVLSTAKGNFDDILFLQRNFESRIQQRNDVAVSLGLMNMLQSITEQKLHQNMQYLDNFVYGSKKVPKNSKLAVSNKWTLQNVIYYEGDLYIDGRVVLEDLFRIFTCDCFADVMVIRAVLESVIADLGLGEETGVAAAEESWVDGGDD